MTYWRLLQLSQKGLPGMAWPDCKGGSASVSSSKLGWSNDACSAENRYPAIHHLFCTILAYSCYVSSFLLHRPQRTCTSFLRDRLHRKYNIPLNMFPHGLQLKATTKIIRWYGVSPLSYVMSLSLCSLGSGKAMTWGLPSKRYLRRGGPLATLVWELLSSESWN